MKNSLLKILLLEANFDKDVVMDLIRNNRIATIYYEGDKENKPGWRTILPVAYGNHESERYGTKDYIRAWQWKGKTVTGIPEWKLFRVDRMRNWNLASSQVIKNVPDNRYNALGDKWMDTLYIHAKFDGSGDAEKPEPPKPDTPPEGSSSPKSPAPTKPSPSSATKPAPKKPKPAQPGLEKPKEEPGLEQKAKAKKKLKEAISSLVKDILKN